MAGQERPRCPICKMYMKYRWAEEDFVNQCECKKAHENLEA